MYSVGVGVLQPPLKLSNEIENFIFNTNKGEQGTCSQVDKMSISFFVFGNETFLFQNDFINLARKTWLRCIVVNSQFCLPIA